MNKVYCQYSHTDWGGGPFRGKFWDDTPRANCFVIHNKDTDIVKAAFVEETDSSSDWSNKNQAYLTNFRLHIQYE